MKVDIPGKPWGNFIVYWQKFILLFSFPIWEAHTAIVLNILQIQTPM